MKENFLNLEFNKDILDLVNRYKFNEKSQKIRDNYKKSQDDVYTVVKELDIIMNTHQYNNNIVEIIEEG